MSKQSVSPTRAFFDQLQASKPAGNLIALELEQLAPKSAKALRCCGRYGIGHGALELLQAPAGYVFTRGVKWCGSRYCPICWPRMVKVLQARRQARARAAAAAGVSVAFGRFSVERCEPGELLHSLERLQSTWRAVFPPVSRLPSAWLAAGLSDFLGFDWSVEIDWDVTAHTWHAHIHALAFKASPWSPAQLGSLRSFWPLDGWSDEAHTPEAAARYIMKLEPDDPERLTLHGLARAGLLPQVAELLQAVQGRRLRGQSLKLSELLSLESGEDDSALAAALEQQDGNALEQLTLRDWNRRW